MVLFFFSSMAVAQWVWEITQNTYIIYLNIIYRLGTHTHAYTHTDTISYYYYIHLYNIICYILYAILRANLSCVHLHFFFFSKTSLNWRFMNIPHIPWINTQTHTHAHYSTLSRTVILYGWHCIGRQFVIIIILILLGIVDGVYIIITPIMY